jgi:hypothetical protein
MFPNQNKTNSKYNQSAAALNATDMQPEGHFLEKKQKKQK